MLNALRATMILLLLVGTAHAGETLIPPAPTPLTMSNTFQEPSSGERLDAETALLGVSDSVADAALELLAILPALL